MLIAGGFELDSSEFRPADVPTAKKQGCGLGDMGDSLILVLNMLSSY